MENGDVHAIYLVKRSCATNSLIYPKNTPRHLRGYFILYIFRTLRLHTNGLSMLFNSIEFVIFVPIVFAIYWSLSNINLKFQNSFILLSSYFFYGWWDWKFLFLILLSTTTDFYLGKHISFSSNIIKRKVLLVASIAINIGILAIFKYYNFFIENFVNAFSFFGISLNISTLNIILPVGISFYTFQTLSYSIDIYRKKIEPVNCFISFASFVSFFPQLVAGPIERASHLLPQFTQKRKFSYVQASDGMRQILWGLFKKIVIADNCARFVNDIFSSHHQYSGSTLFLGAILFSFQIYGDFSGYSDIAIGTARLFGINLKQNFSFPYFSKNIKEFWRRWHISLSSWLRDYIYFPLGGGHSSPIIQIRNIIIVFVLCGLWHGANWTFVAWGIIHAFLYVLQKVAPIPLNRLLPAYIVSTVQITFTFLMTTLAWVFFRADSIPHALSYFSGIFSNSLLSTPEILPIRLFVIITSFLLIEWIQRHKQHGLDICSHNTSGILRWSCYYSLITLTFVFGAHQQTFIYFQF